MLTIHAGHRLIKGTTCRTFTLLIANAHSEKLSATSHFTNDLGLDSLDTVEVVMAIEEVGFPYRRTAKKRMVVDKVHRSSALKSLTRRPMLSTAVRNNHSHC